MNTAWLRQIKSWQKAIAAYLTTQHPELTSLQRSHIIRSLIHQILYLYLCEQRGLIAPGTLQDLQQGDRLDSRLAQLWQQAYLCPDQSHFSLIKTTPLSDTLLRKLIRSFYMPQPNVFSEVSIESLGQAYEQWAHDKKMGGIFYTPPAIVRYIVQNTVGTLLSPSTHFLPTLRILDPACGGGAFLLAAYQFLLDWQLQHYVANNSVANNYIANNSVANNLDNVPAGELANNSARNSGHYAQMGTEYPSRFYYKQGKWRLTQAERSRILQENIYGVDLDPQAVEVTKCALWLKVLEDAPDPKDVSAQIWRSLPDLSRNIQCGNALIGSDFYTKFPFSKQQNDSIKVLDWHKAFPEVLQAGGFDVVIGNPPYIDSESMVAHYPDWRRYCTTHYQTAAGNWDIFCVFIEKAIELCRPLGLTSLVVPNKLTSAGYAAQARKLLTQENRLLSIRDYSQLSLFPAAVYPLVYIAQKHSPESEPTEFKASVSGASVRYELMQGLEQISQQHSLMFCRTTAESELPWAIATPPHQAQLIARLQQTFPNLASIAQVTGAATVAEAYTLQSAIEDQQTIKIGDLKLVNSGTIDRYCLLWGKKLLRYLGAFYQHPILSNSQIERLSTKRQQQAKQPKIIVAGMTRGLECALDEAGLFVAGKSTSVIQFVDSSGIDLRYLLGLLNSQLFHFYFTTCFEGNRLQGGFFRVGPPQLRQLPICLPSLNEFAGQQRYDQIITLVEQMLTLQQQLQRCHILQEKQQLQQQCDRLDQAIDQQVYKLYELTNLEIEMVEISKK